MTKTFILKWSRLRTISRGNRNIILYWILNCFTELWRRSGFIRTTAVTRQCVEQRPKVHWTVSVSQSCKYDMCYSVGNKAKAKVEKSSEQIFSLIYHIAHFWRNRANDRVRKSLLGNSALHSIWLHLLSCLNVVGGVAISSAASANLHNAASLLITDELVRTAKLVKCVRSELQTICTNIFQLLICHTAVLVFSFRHI